MAARYSTVKGPSGRNSPRPPIAIRSGRLPEAEIESEEPWAPLLALIERERLRLIRAHSVLACACHALLYQEDFEEDVDGPAFNDVVDVARELVSESVNGLDSIHVGPLLPALAKPIKGKRQGR